MKYGKMPLDKYFQKLGFKNMELRERLHSIAGGVEDFSTIGFLFVLLRFSQKNAGYPIGGSMPFTMRMAEKYKALGGGFSGKSRVEKILRDGNRAVGVRLDDGSLKYADYIVGACDLHAIIYDMLDGKYLSPKIEKAFAEWPLFKPIVQVSFGISRPLKANFIRIR